MSIVVDREQMWQRWQQANFSWGGLAKQLVWYAGGSHRELTLQHYWRSDPATGDVRDDDALKAAGELIDCDGMLFHIVHLPQQASDGTLTWKADLDAAEWRKLEEIASARLAAAASTTGLLNDPEHPAQLQGGVFRGAVRQSGGSSAPLNVCFHSAMFLADVNYEGFEFCTDTSFQLATFFDGARFDSAVFDGHSWFSGAVFLSSAWFNQTSFRDAVWFTDTSFTGGAGFHHSTFSGDAHFRHASFSAGVGFGHAKFLQELDLDYATFREDAAFSHASFSARASFERATFLGEARFWAAAFSEEARFRNAAFQGQARFGEIRFGGAALFARASFRGGAFFNDSAFLAHAWFTDAHFFGKVLFSRSVFEKIASFNRITWPDEGRLWHRTFNTTRFRGQLILSGSKSSEGKSMWALAAFDGVVAEGGIVLDPMADADADRLFRWEMRSARDAANVDDEGEVTSEKERPLLKDIRLAELERGCRMLKQAMEKSANKAMEQRFHRYELISHREQRSTPLVERIFSHFYELTANYGSSLGRPIGALLIVWLAFAGIFWVIAHGFDASLGAALHPSGRIDPLAMGALSFSASRVLPGGAFENVSREWITALAECRSAELIFLVRVLASLESVVAVVLAFVFGLSVRRKFQIA